MCFKKKSDWQKLLEKKNKEWLESDERREMNLAMLFGKGYKKKVFGNRVKR